MLESLTIFSRSRGHFCTKPSHLRLRGPGAPVRTLVGCKLIFSNIATFSISFFRLTPPELGVLIQNSWGVCYILGPIAQNHHAHHIHPMKTGLYKPPKTCKIRRVRHVTLCLSRHFAQIALSPSPIERGGNSASKLYSTFFFNSKKNSGSKKKSLDF